mmetsp:Transcript_30159/g.54709  ORF Transcript_30159/g.54709 Transcript_30159/m.54709 type:complete len:103 (-) Transcript_30159:939-1247(-)
MTRFLKSASDCTNLEPMQLQSSGRFEKVASSGSHGSVRHRAPGQGIAEELRLRSSPRAPLEELRLRRGRGHGAVFAEEGLELRWGRGLPGAPHSHADVVELS